MTVEFPRALLREQSHSWNLAGSAISGGTTVASVSTLVRSDGGGFWTCTMSNVSLSGRNGIPDRNKDRQRKSTLLWRAVQQICDGGVNPIVVPRNDALFVPWPDGVARNAGDNIPHGDDALFSDDGGYYQSTIDVIVSADAALRATSLSIEINNAGELVGGEAFSINHENAGWRMYVIRTISDDGGTITVNPPLREAVTAGTALEFDRPRCTMRLVQPSSMNLTVQPWTFNTANADFIEAPWVVS